MTTEKITGIVLAGGKSKRMGKDKSKIPFHGKSLIEYPIQLLHKFCDEILISAEIDKYSEYPYAKVPDETKNNGPLLGIYSCLKASKNKINIVVTCDMPMLSDALTNYLINHSLGFDLVMPFHKGHHEPLFSIYTKALIPVIESLFAKNDYGPLSLIPLVNFKQLVLDESLHFYSPLLFQNMNTIEDLQKII